MQKPKFFIIVLYKCNLNSSEAFVSIKASLKLQNEQAYLYIYDNSSVKQIINETDPVWMDVTYIHDVSNPGLGIAYNSGVQIATKLEIDWVVLLDQDTQFSKDYIEKLNKGIAKFESIKLFAPIIKLSNGDNFSPTRYRFKRGNPVKMHAGFQLLKKYSPVNSGLAININAFNKAGGYNENIKLDFADFQFIEKFRIQNQYFFLLDTIAIQDFSNMEQDTTKKIIRFEIYLECAKNCDRRSVIDDIQYLYVVSRHVLALTIKTKNFTFAKLFFTKYLRDK